MAQKQKITEKLKTKPINNNSEETVRGVFSNYVIFYGDYISLTGELCINC